jgi:HD-like signal output (HDOD) protein
MLHGIGHIVLCQLQPEPMRELINDSGDRRPIAERQRERFGFDYADLGAGLLARWNLPESLCGAVQFHTRPAQADGTGLAAAWVHIASVLTESAAWAPGTAEPPEMDPVAFQITGIEVEAIEGILEEADEQVAAAVRFLVPDAPASARRELNVAESALA